MINDHSYHFYCKRSPSFSSFLFQFCAPIQVLCIHYMKQYLTQFTNFAISEKSDRTCWNATLNTTLSLYFIYINLISLQKLFFLFFSRVLCVLLFYLYKMSFFICFRKKTTFLWDERGRYLASTFFFLNFLFHTCLIMWSLLLSSLLLRSSKNKK